MKSAMVELLRSEHEILDKQIILGYACGNSDLFARYQALNLIFGSHRRLHRKQVEIKVIETSEELLLAAKGAYNQVLDLFQNDDRQRNTVAVHLEHIVNMAEGVCKTTAA
jgi:hypothetical protein